jgi:hypothetical protein
MTLSKVTDVRLRLLLQHEHRFRISSNDRSGNCEIPFIGVTIRYESLSGFRHR